ncbi:copper oxidase [Nocardioides marmoriginsengisoli]|uniref:Copper oxidase n=1 Tax=Nocardioides marmoriginsengisoli TaxID=661483 RepID=A0A3N0CJA9_9ACTN|nr:copper oxidase [Nocardioides marmoriginsengisoli]
MVAAGLVAAGGFVALAARVWLTAPIDTTGDVDFDRPLAIPPLASSTVVDGERIFDLRLQEGVADFGRGRTPTWGVNGDYLGPTLRAERGERVRIRVRNDLGEDTSLHWHGMHLPAAMDGGPHQPVGAGATWTPHWRIDQTAATLWYHPHLHGKTAAHVYRGLAGLFVLDDAKERSLPLPRSYGVDDIPVILQDKKLHDDGSLDEDAGLFRSAGLTGDTVVVNGTVGPYLDVSTEAVRLRVVNASNTRPYSLRFDDGSSFAMIASDGGLLDAPIFLTRLQLSVGERAEIVVALDPGERRVLRSGPSDSGDRLAGGGDRLDLLELRAADELRPAPALPAALTEQPALAEDEAVRTRTFDLAGFSINGRTMDLGRIDHASTVGDTEIWEVTNADGGSHNFHVHDVQFQVLAVDGEPPPPELAGQKDTVWIRPKETVRLIMRFEGYTSPGTPYMFHCHTLRHEDLGMMGQFVVVEPGQAPDDHVAGSAAGHH